MKDFFEFREASLAGLKEEYSSSDAYDMSPEEIAKVLTKFIKDADKRSKAKATKLKKLETKKATLEKKVETLTAKLDKLEDGHPSYDKTEEQQIDAESELDDLENEIDELDDDDEEDYVFGDFDVEMAEDWLKDYKKLSSLKMAKPIGKPMPAMKFPKTKWETVPEKFEAVLKKRRNRSFDADWFENIYSFHEVEDAMVGATEEAIYNTNTYDFNALEEPDRFVGITAAESQEVNGWLKGLASGRGAKVVHKGTFDYLESPVNYVVHKEIKSGLGDGDDMAALGNLLVGGYDNDYSFVTIVFEDSKKPEMCWMANGGINKADFKHLDELWQSWIYWKNRGKI